MGEWQRLPARAHSILAVQDLGSLLVCRKKPQATQPEPARDPPTPQHPLRTPARSHALRRWTDVFVVPPAAGQTTVGFHAIGHTITSVAVNGVPAEFTLVPPSPQPELTEASTKPTVKDIAEQAYYNYAAQMARELQPELVIQLPAGWDSQEQHLKTPEEAKQQVLQQAEQGPQSGQQPQGEGTQAIQGDPAQGPQGEGTQGPPGPAAGALDVATHAEGATDPPAAADAATGGAAPAAGPDAAGAAGAAGQGAVAPVDTGSAAHTPAAKAANSQVHTNTSQTQPSVNYECHHAPRALFWFHIQPCYA